MNISWLSAIGVIAMLAASSISWAVKPSASEMKQARDWFSAHLGQNAKPFLSFTYGGRPSTEFLSGWAVETASKKLDRFRTERTVTYTDPASGLQVKAVAVAYGDFPVVEWTVFLRNGGRADTPIVENVRPLDVEFNRSPTEAEFALHHNQGSMTSNDDFQPFVTPLPAGVMKRLASEGGRPMSSTMPYYGLAWGNQGVLVAVSWLGDWYSELTRNGDTGIRVTAGWQIGHFTLHPGEEVRTPMIAMMFWQGGDTVRAHNLWRRWMVAHNLPKPGGKDFPVRTSSGIPDKRGNLITTESEELEGIAQHAKRKLPVDVWWRDAGWYPCGDGWWNVGTWEPDPVRFPHGLKPMSDAAHKAGMILTVWFEIERAVPGSRMYADHPEWLLGKDGEQKVLDLGNKKAWHWLVDFVDKFITDQGIDMYRQDYNIDPTGPWRDGEPDDRRGITEIRQVAGMLAFWDELKRKHPNMPFDNCAGGGRRNVLEMMRRGVPLSKTDQAGGTASSQAQLMGLAPWLPYFGAGIGETDDIYQLRSNMAPWSAFAFECKRVDLNWDVIRRHMQLCHSLAPNMLGDFYPLTAYSLKEDVWAAWQFDRPELGVGMVQAFRRPMSSDSFMVFRLRGLDPNAAYEVRNVDSDKADRLSGESLMSKGLRVRIDARPGAVIVVYRKVGK